ncbi:MAG: substrate-binding domain-containing protein [Acidimicrobiales bacterium]|nr:substrate-binding domain-containing protein [Acidimicrobiales bacterium]
MRARGGRRRWVLAAVAALVAAGLVVACTGGGGGDDSGDLADADPGDCITVDMAVSSEKIALLTDLARSFNASDEAVVGDQCVFVRPYSKASGAATTLLAEGWPNPDVEGARPVVWSPASSAWGALLNQRLADQGEAAMAPPSQPFMLTPLVIAMPRPMAEALGWPDEPIGFTDIAALATNGEGWGAYGHPEWGQFKLGRTNPNFSTSGLSFTIGEYYAATGKTSDLTLEDLDRPDVEGFVRSVESSVAHYGDITMTFLNNWFRADQRGTALTYVSAVAVEEKSVIDYNQGNPDGVLDPGEEPRPPRVPLVAVYPEEGTLFSDNPFIVLDAPWVTPEQQEGAALFEGYVQRPENQQRVLEFGFRPGNPEVAIGAPITAANGVDPDQPQTLVEVPEPPVLERVLELWAEQRKTARVLLVVDVSGSMGDLADPDTGATKLDLAKEAAIDALDQFKPDDEVGLRIFSTDLGPDGQSSYVDLLSVGPIGPQREQMKTMIRNLVPTNGTPLYEVTGDSYDELLASYDPARINAVVLLTDGMNDDGDPSDDDEQLDQLLADLRVGSEGQASRPVRVFPIAYGEDADLATLRRIAEATAAAVYDASDPASINKVFTAVISNF